MWRCLTVSVVWVNKPHLCWALSCLPCRSDDGARSCRLPLTHSPPAFYSCFSWTYLHLLLNPPGLSSRIQQLRKSWFCAPRPPLKTLNWSLSVDGEARSRWRTVKARSARSYRSGSAQFSLKNAEYSFRVMSGAGERKDQHFSDDARGFRQCVWSVRFYAVSTTWTPSHRSSHVPAAPVPSELPWQREEGGHTARLIFGQYKHRDAYLCKITQLFSYHGGKTRKWLFTVRMTQMLCCWADLCHKPIHGTSRFSSFCCVNLFSFKPCIFLSESAVKTIQKANTQHSLSVYILGNICCS